MIMIYDNVCSCSSMYAAWLWLVLCLTLVCHFPKQVDTVQLVDVGQLAARRERLKALGKQMVIYLLRMSSDDCGGA